MIGPGFESLLTKNFRSQLKPPAILHWEVFAFNWCRSSNWILRCKKKKKKMIALGGEFDWQLSLCFYLVFWFPVSVRSDQLGSRDAQLPESSNSTSSWTPLELTNSTWTCLSFFLQAKYLLGDQQKKKKIVVLYLFVLNWIALVRDQLVV